ncbi:hypothetical protein [Tessaracoccus sp.]
MTDLTPSDVLAFSLPLLIIGGVTAVTWLLVRRRHRREREQGTYRPPLLLRITGLMITIFGAILLAVGVKHIAEALSAGAPLTDDPVAQAVIGAVFLLAGLFLWLKNSTRLTLGAESLSYSKYLVVRGTMHYRDLTSVRATQTTKVWTITFRDMSGKKLDIPAGAPDWTPLVEWALANNRPDIYGVFLQAPDGEAPTG